MALGSPSNRYPGDSQGRPGAAFEGSFLGKCRGELERVGRWGRVIPHFEASKLNYIFIKKYFKKYDIVASVPGTQVSTPG